MGNEELLVQCPECDGSGLHWRRIGVPYMLMDGTWEYDSEWDTEPCGLCGGTGYVVSAVAEGKVSPHTPQKDELGEGTDDEWWP